MAYVYKHPYLLLVDLLFLFLQGELYLVVAAACHGHACGDSAECRQKQDAGYEPT